MTLRKLEIDKTVYEASKERIHQLADRVDYLSVLFSGGKDSTVCLNLAIEVAQERGMGPIDVVHWDEEAMPPPTIEYVRRVSQHPMVRMRWFCVPIKHRNACSKRQPYWYCWAPEDRAKWCYDLPPEAITDLPGLSDVPISKRKAHHEITDLIYPADKGHVGQIIGMRANESLRRHRLVTSREYDNWLWTDPQCANATRALVIYDWDTPNVWTAPRTFGWDYNHTYDAYSRAGISPHMQRVCPPFGEEPLQRLWQYAQLWPELWEKMLKRVEGAAAAGRYSRSPLYKFNDKAKEPPPGMTWQQAITHELNGWPADLRAEIAKRIASEIRIHNRQTKNGEIPGYSDEGLSWSLLYTIASRGDTKRRRSVPFKTKVGTLGEDVGAAVASDALEDDDVDVARESDD